MPDIGPSEIQSASLATPTASPHRRVRLAFLAALAVMACAVEVAFEHGSQRAILVSIALVVLMLVVVVEPVVRLVRRQHALALRHTRQLERLSVAAQRTTNAVVFTDARRRITWVNQGFTRICGYTLDEVIGKSPGSVLQCERTSRDTIATMRAALDAGEAFRGDILNRAKDGHDYWLDLDIQPLHDADGTLTGFSAIETDITEQVVQRERLSSIFDTVTEGVVVIAPDASILESNRAARLILGLSEDQLHGRASRGDSWGNIHLDGSPMAEEELPGMVTLQTGQPLSRVLHGVRLNDLSRRWISVSTQPMFDPRGAITSVVASFSDVTTMLDQEHRMQFVVQGAKLGTWDWHVPTGQVVYNARSAEILGYTPSEFLPNVSMWESLLHPDDKAVVLKELTAHLEGRTPEFRCEQRQRRKDGTWAWVLGAGQVIERAADGQPIRATGINLDMSAQKALAQRLVETQERYEAAIAGTSDGLWDWNVATDEVWLSPRCLALFGYAATEAAPTMPLGLSGPRLNLGPRLHPDDQAATQRALEELRSNDVPFDIPMRLQCEDGEYHWFRTRCSAQRDEAGQPIRLAGSVQNIDAQKAADAVLQRTMSQMEEAQSLARTGSWSFDLSTGRIEWSTQCYLLQGLDPAQGPPDYPTMLALYADEDAARLDAAVTQTATAGVPYSLLLHMRHENAGVRVVRADARAQTNADGTVVGMFGTVTDITADIDREDALRRAQAEAEDASQQLLEINRVLEDATMRANDMAAQAEMASHAKSEFLANMSHEIRTPLTAILGYADILREELIDSETGAHAVGSIDTIQRAGAHLLVVINDILDLSKIEAGAMQIESVEMALPQLLFDLDSMMQARAHAKNITLRTSLGTPIPDRVLSDPTRLRQILMNLVGNAIKFTDEGSVEVRVRVATSEAREGVVLRIEVEDTGPGMTPKQARTLFQPFTQADTTVTRRHGGTGLGLTICRRLAGLMQGTVRLDRTAPGQGSRFVVELPLVATESTPMVDNLDVFVRRRPAASASITAPPTGRLRGRILLAEDGEDNRRLIIYHLTKAGAAVDFAVNGRVALELIEASRLDGRPYDLLVTDMQMPVMDGYTLARTLRKRGSVMPIVALTAHAMAEDRDKCLEAGCNDYATKPIDRARLVATCAAWLPSNGAEADAAADVVPAVAAVHGGQNASRGADDVLISDLADDPDMLPLVHEFLHQLSDRMALFDSHRELEQRSALASAAHQLKGAAGGYGYMSISELARTVERYASAGGTQAECDKAINALLSRCRAAIRGGQTAETAGDARLEVMS